jgi:ribosomal protein L32
MSVRGLASLQADIDRIQEAQRKGASRSCARKVRYKTEREARHIVEKRARAQGVSLRAYKCPTCGGWHLTHVLDTEIYTSNNNLKS